MKKKIAGFLMVIVVAVILFSCKHEIPFKPGENPLPVDTSAAERVCFKYDILPIFLGNCAVSTCHDAGSKEGGHQLDSWANITGHGLINNSASNSKLYEVLIEDDLSDRMPKDRPALTQTQLNLIAKWINQGARNDSTNCTNSCDSSQSASYNNNVKPVIQTHCLGCHGGLAENGGSLPLDTYNKVKEAARTGPLFVSINRSPGAIPMPKNAAKLSDCEIAIVRKWIESGYPQ